MILSDIDIKRAMSKKEIKVRGTKDLYIGPSSMDLHLGNTVKELIALGNGDGFSPIDTKDSTTAQFAERKFQKLIVEPGEFYLVSTKEELTFGDSIVGFIQGRSSLARIGLNIHAAGFFDAGFRGTATLELTNFTKKPIILYPNMRICQMVFARTESPSQVPYSKKKDAKYQGQIKPKESKIYEEKI